MSDDLDRLGRRHKQLRDQLDELIPKLHQAMRREREAGATLTDIMVRSGYQTIQQVRTILMTEEEREAERAKRRAKAAAK